MPGFTIGGSNSSPYDVVKQVGAFHPKPVSEAGLVEVMVVLVTLVFLGRPSFPATEGAG